MKRYTLCALLILFLNTSAFAWEDGGSDDSTARDDTQIYHAYDGIDIVSTLKFQYDKPRVVIKSVFPQLESDYLSDSLEVFNRIVTDFIVQQVNEFKFRVAENKNSDTEHKNNFYIDYDSSTIKSNDDHIISVRFSMQGSIAGVAHPYHYHRVINYNLDTQQQINLADLFNPDSDYLNVIANYVRAKLEHHFGNKEMIAQGTAPTFENYLNWNIKPNGLIFTFDENQVAPYVYGAQSVFVPFSLLKPLMSVDSPIIGCIKHKWKCKQHNLLTGGFLEEANATSVKTQDLQFAAN